jgi:hypothetical protein
MSAGVWIIVYYISHSFLIPHIRSSTANMSMRNDCDAPSQTQSVRLSPILMSTLIFCQCSERISIAKITQDLHICKICIDKYWYFVGTTVLVTGTIVKV